MLRTYNTLQLKTDLAPGLVLEKLRQLIEPRVPGILENISRVYERVGTSDFYHYYAQERDDEKWYYGTISGLEFRLEKRYTYSYLPFSKIKKIKHPMMGAERGNTDIRGSIRPEVWGSSMLLRIRFYLHVKVFFILWILFLLAGSIGGVITSFREGFDATLALVCALFGVLAVVFLLVYRHMQKVEYQRLRQDLEKHFRGHLLE